MNAPTAAPSNVRPRPRRASRVAVSAGLATGLATVALASGAVTAPAVPAAATAPTGEPAAQPMWITDAPNIVVLLADDLGYRDLSTDAFGGRGGIVQTPAMDRMVTEGAAFVNAYSAPSCSPARMAMLTGLPAEHPENNAFQVGSLQAGIGKTPLVPPSQGHDNGEIYIPDHTRTVAEVARVGGYETSYVGKFHVDREPSDVTTVHGFDVYADGRKGGVGPGYFANDERFDPERDVALNRYAEDYTQQYVDEYVRPYSDGTPSDAIDALVGTPKHVTDAVADSVEDLVGVGQRPTFTFVGHYAPHKPVDDGQARPDLYAKYAQDVSATGHIGYAALIEGLDQTIARLMDHLETTPDPRDPSQDLAENTVVIVTSDNGGRTDHGADNGPLTGQKGEVREGGIRVPMMAWSGDPALVKPGVVNDTIVRGVDLLPTVADYARVGTRASGASAEPGSGGGNSLVKILATGETGAQRSNFVHLPGYWRAATLNQRPETVMRWSRWKVAWSYEKQAWTLTDLSTDVGEQTDLSQSKPQALTRSATRLMRWMDRHDLDTPTLPAGAPTWRSQVAPGDLVYRDGRLVTIRTARDLLTRPGDPVPVVLRAP